MRHALLGALVLSLWFLWSCTVSPGGYVRQTPPPVERSLTAGLVSTGAGAEGNETATVPAAVRLKPVVDLPPVPPQAQVPVEAKAAVTAVKTTTVQKSVGNKPAPRPPATPIPLTESSEFAGRLREYTSESEEAEAVAVNAGKATALAQKTIDRVLLLLEQSQERWEKADLDGALALLDQAGGLTLEIHDGPEVTWQREDLRFIIAKRIVEIYAARSAGAVGLRSEIPLSTAAEVEAEIRRFQNQERSFFLSAYRRSGAYRPMIVELLREAGLPEELSWLPLVESGFNLKAFSPARALGLWQFIASTGYKFGLKRDEFVDERMDPEQSTLAAIAYLKELHGIFGDWQTALAAYNCGEGRVLRVISGQQMNYLDNFWDLYRNLPSETRRYVPRFLAMIRIIKEPEKYGFDLAGEPLDEPLAYEKVSIAKSMRLADIARRLGADEKDLERLNAELRLKKTPEKNYSLKVPPGQAEPLLAALENIPAATRTAVAQTSGSVTRHQVRKGDSLSAIAARYGSSVSAIARANKLSQNNFIRVGQVLTIPGTAARAVAAKAAPTKANTVITHKVKAGDSLFQLAQKFNTTVAQIQRINQLDGFLIAVGQVLRIPVAG